MTDPINVPSSFQDPSGFVFQHNGIYYRKVNLNYASHYDVLMRSGLYDHLTKKRWLLTHTELSDNSFPSPDLYKILLPRQLSFISYAYEWSFDMMKDAALLTLSIYKTALAYGMTLKDATPFNIQFLDGRPVLIDTLSFEILDEKKPWVAYRQFCETFLFPLYLEYYLRINIKKTLISCINGIPADVTASLLPLRSKLNAGVWLHVHLQNAIKGRHKNSGKEKFSKAKSERLLEHLQSIIEKLKPRNVISSSWSNYYNESVLSTEYLQSKEKILREFLNEFSYRQVLDLGANDGYFSLILTERATEVVAVDLDSQCINNLYALIKNQRLTKLVPLVIDLANPSPAAGFNNSERAAFADRIHPDLVLALALVHHLVISRNIPLPLLAKWLVQFSPMLIIEFVPPEDIKVQQMTENRGNTFDKYNLLNFEEAFSEYFTTIKKMDIAGSLRTLYFMQRITT